MRTSSLLAFLLLSCAYSSTADTPRPEHPRPDFVRDRWTNLNGAWEFEFDDRNVGVREKWYSPTRPLGKTIQVPYCFQSRLSGIGDPSFHDVVWYRRTFEIPDAWRSRMVRLNFGAVDYRCQVWINGESVGTHEGGQTPFSFDITPFLHTASAGSSSGRSNVIVLRAEDPSSDLSIPRGKQFWEPKSRGIWYTRTSGIWQTVWLEAVPESHLERVIVRSNIDEGIARFEARINRFIPGLRFRVSVHFNGEFQVSSETRCTADTNTVTVQLPAQRLWSPERPDLYDAVFELRLEEKLVDSVKSYFGQRKVSTREGKVYLNNRPYFLKMVLDQGYWPDGVLTPPTDEAIQQDIRATKTMGFNGARKHQKVEDPRYLYWADRMGLLVSGEMANAQSFTDDYVSRMVREWMDVVLRDINHPSIITWYPINESWGVPQVRTNTRQKDHIRSLYYLTRSLDPSRLVVDNDGWEHTEATDLFTIHDYAARAEVLAPRFASLPDGLAREQPAGRSLLVDGARYNGTPIVVSEFGGIAYRPAGASQKAEEWGYSGIEPTEDSFLARLEGLVKTLRSNPKIAGYCYTQLTDVEQEINGLLTYDRKFKVDPEKVNKIQQ